MRRFLLNLLLITVLLLFVSACASAAESGTVAGFTWTLSDSGCLTITGRGALPDWVTEDDYRGSCPWAPYRDDVTSVVIGDGITRIGDLSFAYFTANTSVTMPDSVTELGYAAFYDNAALTSITLSPNITYIPTECFGYCGFQTFRVPEGITGLSWNSFRYCTSLTSVTLPSTLRFMGGNEAAINGGNAFADCPSLRSITLASGNTSLKLVDGVLYTANMETLLCAIPVRSRPVTIPESVRNLGWGAFAGFRYEQELIVPENVTFLNNHVFAQADGLTSVVFRCPITEIPSNSFLYNRGVRSVTLPETVTTIGDGAFNGCTSLASVNLPDGITYIGSYAFDNCAMTSLRLPASLRRLGNRAFQANTRLTSVTVPEGVVSMGDLCFYYCLNLQSLFIPDSVTEFGQRIVGHGDEVESVPLTIYCSRNSAAAAYAAKNGLTVRYLDAANGCLILPDTVTELEAGAFAGCGIERIDLNASLRLIGSRAFADNAQLIRVTIPSMTLSIPADAFSGSPNVIVFCPDGSQAQKDCAALGIPCILIP